MNKKFKTVQECEHYLNTLRHAIDYGFIGADEARNLFEDTKKRLVLLKTRNEGFEIVVHAAYPMTDAYDEKCTAHLFKVTEDVTCVKFEIGDTPMRVLVHQNQLEKALLGIHHEYDEINDTLSQKYFDK